MPPDSESSLFEHIDVPAFVHDTETGKIPRMNARFRERMGFDGETSGGVTVEDVTIDGWLPPTPPETVADEYDTGDSISEEWRYRPLEATPFSAMTTLTNTDNGQVLATVDVDSGTDESRANQLAALFENLPEPAVRYHFEEGEPIIKAVNAAFEEVYGYEASEVMDESVDQYIVPPENAKVAKNLNTKVRNGELLDAEVERKTAEGVRTFLIRNAPIETDEGTHGYAIYTDIDERKRKEEELQELNLQLELLNRVVRHDISNDMNVILGMADQLRRHVTGDGEPALERLIDKSNHVVNITNVIRDYMTVLLEDESETKALELWPVIEDEVEDARASYDDATVRVASSPTNTTVLANEMLESVFRNLLKNAIQHNDKDAPEVAVSLSEATETVCVSIADNGPGIADNQKEVVFGRGEQGLESHGTGLGLYLVDTILDEVDGEVWIEDNDPEGAVFHVELQRA